MNITTIQGSIINLDPNNVIWTQEQNDGTIVIMLRTGNIIRALENPFEYIPSEYELLDYISMDGRQWTTTQFPANEHSIFKITVDMTDGATGTSVHANTNNGAKTIIAVSYNGEGSDKIGSSQIGLMYNEGCFVNPILYPRGKHTYTIDYHNDIIGWDDNYEVMGPVVNYSQELPFAIGAWYEGGNFHYRMSGKFYKLEVYNGSEQIVNIVPVLRKSDSKPGFFDITKAASTQNPFMTNINTADNGTHEFGYKKKDGTIIAAK